MSYYQPHIPRTERLLALSERIPLLAAELRNENTRRQDNGQKALISPFALTLLSNDVKGATLLYELVETGTEDLQSFFREVLLKPVLALDYLVFLPEEVQVPSVAPPRPIIQLYTPQKKLQDIMMALGVFATSIRDHMGGHFSGLHFLALHNDGPGAQLIYDYMEANKGNKELVLAYLQALRNVGLGHLVNSSLVF